MTAHLIIQDGVAPYWWTSTDIWVVPGNDPNGDPGQPIVGQPAYLWARVNNTGQSAANGTRVDFYWANPSAQVVVGVATKIGSAFVDLEPGETQDVLCLVAWIPVLVNGGHECLIAVAHGLDDLNPLPNPLPNGFPFDPPAHEQIAQVNISVLLAAKLSAGMAVMVNATARSDKHVLVAVEYGGELAPELLRRLGLKKLHLARKHVVMVKLSREQQCGNGGEDKPQLEMEVRRGTSAPVYVALQAKQLPSGQYQVIHIVERDGEKILGGVTYVVINPDKEVKS